MSTVRLANNTQLITAPAAIWRTRARASVIIVNYNGRAHLDRCLNSLLIGFNANDEIILVDNASIDGSAEYVEQTFPTVRVIRSETNQGFAGGCNIGAQWTTGQYLAFLNPDTVVVPGWLDALVAALEADPQVGLTTSKILLLDDTDRINTCGNDMHYTGLTLCRGMGIKRDALTSGEEVSAVSGAAFVIRQELFEALHGFDESFFMYMEDSDLSWRARLAGYRCIYVPDSVIYHDYTLRFGPEKTFYQERNRYLMLLKGLRWQTLLALLPALFLAEVVTWGFIIVQERRWLANKVRAYDWIRRHWGEIIASRRQVQALRRVGDRHLIGRCTYRLAFEQVGHSPVTRLARLVFDPLFFLLQRLALAVMRW
jgi:GT2 family glycosyltransferase